MIGIGFDYTLSLLDKGLADKPVVAPFCTNSNIKMADVTDISFKEWIKRGNLTDGSQLTRTSIQIPPCTRRPHSP
jgi:hypothetical protein